jgi:hypothetical protein
MRLLPGSSATTAPMCVGVDYPSLRFFARRSGGLLADALVVEAVLVDSAGNERALVVGSVGNAGVWAPTQPLPVAVGAFALTSGHGVSVAFRFTPRGSAQWSIDDVYVDPFRT